MRVRKSPLRKGKFNQPKTMRADIDKMVQDDGTTITFEWKETTGGTWNETYELWEGGTTETVTEDARGFGKVVDYAEDEMEYEWGRVGVGDCLVYFSHDFDIEKYKDKDELRFIYKGQRWKPDSELGVGEWMNDQLITKMLKGVKSLD